MGTEQEVRSCLRRLSAFRFTVHDIAKAFCNAVICSVSHEQGDPGTLCGGGGIPHISIPGGTSDPRTSCRSQPRRFEVVKKMTIRGRDSRLGNSAVCNFASFQTPSGLFSTL